MTNLREDAERRGIALSYEGADGRLTGVPEETLMFLIEALRDTTAVPAEAATPKASPDRCFLPDFLVSGRAWGISLQLYELRSERNAGIGDFADLADFCRIAGALGADFVGCNPLHALFLADPGRCSPFFPSNRRFLNPLYIAVDQVSCVTWSDHQLRRAKWLREDDLVDYAAVTELKLELLRDAWSNWKGSLDLPRADFAAFQAEGGELLRRHALFESLSRHFSRSGEGAGWRGWPLACQDWRSPDIAAFARENEDEIEFNTWLQWLATRQLATAADAARKAGMRIGLYLDFAVAEAPDGSATWSEPDNFLPRIKIGAPPDVFSAAGQDWGLAALSPAVFKQRQAGSYEALLTQVMRGAGALRIDHAMSACRLFVIPEASPAREGTYLRYPMQNVLATMAVLSRRSGCIVIAEDLGNVPPGFREALQARDMLSYRVLCFEHKAGEFRPAASYPRLSLACVTTHDLPPLRGWWNGDDIALRQSQGLVDSNSAIRQQAERRKLKLSLWRILKGERSGPDHMPDAAEDQRWPEVAVAVHRFIARTPSMLVATRLADMTGETRPTNIPGTSEDYPNWRPKLSITLEEFAGSEMPLAIARALSGERPR